MALFRHHTPELSREGPKKGPTFVSAPDLFSAPHRGFSANREIFDLHAAGCRTEAEETDLLSFDFMERSATGCARQPGVTFLGNRYLLARFSQRDAPPLPACPLARTDRRVAFETVEFAGASREFPIPARPSAHVSASSNSLPLYFSE